MNDDDRSHSHPDGEREQFESQHVESKDIIRNTIPTAIVKPKYQKSSYDERQLPLVANVDREKPWFDDDNTSDTIVTTTTKKVQQLPHFERKPKKQLKHLTKSVQGHPAAGRSTQSAKESLNSLLECDKDIDSSLGASVAIVQPRKKEKMEPTLEKRADPVKCPEAFEKALSGIQRSSASNIVAEKVHAKAVLPRQKPKESKEISGKLNSSFDRVVRYSRRKHPPSPF